MWVRPLYRCRKLHLRRVARLVLVSAGESARSAFCGTQNALVCGLHVCAHQTGCSGVYMALAVSSTTCFDTCRGQRYRARLNLGQVVHSACADYQNDERYVYGERCKALIHNLARRNLGVTIVVRVFIRRGRTSNKSFLLTAFKALPTACHTT